ncbi:cryptochrome/photolyase family protein [Lutimonas sp.]|uniref:cryptochrome/photolyase family protein n=1 Tax=Lutimonas sp. TaxID=1872403 RepID=UPI003D9B20A8
MKTIHLIFPHQLFKEIPVKNKEVIIYLIEEELFFNQYSFHKQKILFHRASMKYYQNYLEAKDFKVTYIEAFQDRSAISLLIKELASDGLDKLSFTDPTDYWLEQRIKKSCIKHQLKYERFNSPMFLNSEQELYPFFRADKKKYYQTSFYKEQRKLRKILVSEDQQPIGGKWTYDAENRKKYPVKKKPPPIYFPKSDAYFEEAKDYVQRYYDDNPGRLYETPLYPLNFKDAEEWLEQFFEIRFFEFGTYEDAIVKDASWLHHSMLTPMLNTGLIQPSEVIQRSLMYAKSNDIPINSTEGFIRQIVGWREFIRGIYCARGVEQRTCNFWDFKRKIPDSFYTGTTGIEPVDNTIKKVLQTGYCHHIERLMILGNFMMLCEFDPDEVYRWFMELFIDAYDWVMVPNVYGMSQFADGGLMSTKPYISSSNYLMKMSNFKKGSWQEIWDGLFWRFMDVHRDFFQKNPRLGMLVHTLDKMPVEKRHKHLENSESYLFSLDS